MAFFKTQTEKDRNLVSFFLLNDQYSVFLEKNMLFLCIGLLLKRKREFNQRISDSNCFFEEIYLRR